jgi:hypothetical protein
VPGVPGVPGGDPGEPGVPGVEFVLLEFVLLELGPGPLGFVLFVSLQNGPP